MPCVAADSAFDSVYLSVYLCSLPDELATDDAIEIVITLCYITSINYQIQASMVQGETTGEDFLGEEGIRIRGVTFLCSELLDLFDSIFFKYWFIGMKFFVLTRMNILLQIGCCKKSATDCVDRPVTRWQ